MNAIDKLRDTANSHRRIFIVEVMGRHSGKLAKKIAACSGADFFLIPEQISDTKNLFAEFNHLQQNQKGIIIIVAEGDETGGALQLLKKIKPKLPECDIRCSILGHIQRGGSPTAFDRVIGTKMGKLAIDWITNGKSGVFTAFNNGKILPGVMKKKG
jgi:6-phosphofructokinase 1